MADSIRVPTNTLSLIILNATFQTRMNADGTAAALNTKAINDIYKKTSENNPEHLLIYTTEQNVSTDLIGTDAAVIIEGQFNHSRTAFINVDLTQIPNIPAKIRQAMPTRTMRVPVVHAKIFGWYDNEYGSYTNRMGDLTVHVHKNLL
jgi:glyceraldehyde 3-phosphate dehydrogenase